MIAYIGPQEKKQCDRAKPLLFSEQRKHIDNTRDAMKVSVTVDSPRNGDYFTSIEQVQGRVELGLADNDIVTSLGICFQGR